MYKHIIFLAAILLCSCQHGTQQNTTEQKKSNDAIKNEVSVIIPFTGAWLSENYYNNMLKNKSPRDAQNEGSMFTIIPEHTSTPFMMIHNFHEGSEEVCILKNGNDFQIWNMDLDRKISDIQVMSQNKIKMFDHIFIKINPQKEQNEYLILEEILFKGKYISQKGDTIEFFNNGKIKGMNNVDQYKPVIDYMDMGRNVNLISISSSKDVNDYGFEFINDTLNIYQLNCLEHNEEDCVEIGYEKVIYKMKKVD